MAVTFPEILNDMADARERFEVDGVQFVVRLEPDTVPAGGAASAVVYVQNVLDQPVQFAMTPGQSRTGVLGTGLLRGGPGLKFQTMFPDNYIDLSPGEAGTWRVPLGVPANTQARVWDVSISFRGTSERAQRVRPSKASRKLESIKALVDDYVGLGIVPVTGCDYESRDGHRVSLKLTVTSGGAPEEPPELAPDCTSTWIQNEVSYQSTAQREVNNGRAAILEDLGSPALFEVMCQSAQSRLEGTGMGPQLGETLALGKILTYTTGLFMRDEETQNALLVPAYAEVMRAGHTTSRPVDVLAWSGLAHVIRLSVAVSFSIVARTIGRQPWSVEERRGVTRWVAQCIDQRMSLAPEFLYLPLMLGALTTMPVRMSKDEHPVESFKMLGFAWQSRQAHFKEDPELRDLVEIFNVMARGVVSQVMAAK